MTGNNPVDRSKLGTKRHILTDKNGIPLSAVISSANTHDIKLLTDVIDNSVINRTFESSFSKKKTRRQNRQQQQHLCLDRAYNSKSTENEIINRGYVPHIPYKRKRGQIKKEKTNQKNILMQKINDGLSREPIRGIIDSESCLYDMKRRLKTILDWCNYHAVS